MFAFSKFSIRTQIMIVSMLCSITACSIIGYTAYQRSVAAILNLGGEMFTKVTHDVVGLMDLMDSQVKSGKMSLEEAQESVRIYVLGPKMADGQRDMKKSKLSVDDLMYVWAFSSNEKGLSVMHPFIEGKNVLEATTKGKYTVKETWGNEKNTGKVFREMWQNPGEEMTYFLAYQQLYEPWGWIVGVGGRENVLYETRLAGLKQSFLICSVIALAISIILSYLISHFIAKHLDRIVASLQATSLEVSGAAQHIAAASEELSQATTEQAASLQETAASVEEMSSMVNRNSENAKSTASTSQESHQKAAIGKSVVEKMISSMSDINRSNSAIMDQVTHSNNSMSDVVKVIEEIGNKTKVINEIVFQTKLLSFNASVEAARAGEHGKGFAVVAEEVGNLAQMSGNAAKEITGLLDASVQKVNQIARDTKEAIQRMIDDGRATVDSGTKIAFECRQVLEEIVINVESSAMMAGEIASASAEQARGVLEINKAVGELDQMTQQNATTSEECASAAEELTAQAEALNGVIHQLVMTVKGSSAERARQSDMPSPEVNSQQSIRQSPAARKSKQNVIHLKPSAHGTTAEAKDTFPLRKEG